MSEMIDEYLNGRYETVLQEERLGTGHAVMQAVPFMEESGGKNTLVLCGDAPFIDSETIRKSLEAHERRKFHNRHNRRIGKSDGLRQNSQR